jgi:hypothetical protein
MKSEKRIVKTLAAFALICSLSLVTHAQIGSGWSPGGETILSQQTSSGCTITPISGGYEFHSASSGRAENRWGGADLTTTWQWTGTCKIVSWPSGSSNTCIYQLWGSPSGDLIIDMTSGGGSNTNLMSLHDGDKVVGNVPVGTPFNYAAVYDSGTEYIYINGSQTGTTVLIDSISGGHYDKNGSYVSNSGTGNDTVDWTNTSNWKGGSRSGGGGNTFTITASAGSGGSINPTGAVTVNQGANQTFTITANSGFSISSVTVDGANQGAIGSYTFSNVQANHTIAAAFQSTTTNFTITASAGSGGSISPSGNVVVAQGANKTFTITPNSGFSISSVTVDGANQGAIASYTFSNVQANHTISAAFQTSTTQFTITASAGSGGSISPSGNVLVNQGASQTFSITPSSGYTVSSVTVDNANQGAITSYTFSNVQANHTISAAFTSSSGGCVTATVGGPWQNAAMPSSQSGTFTATFDATPSVSPNNATVGLSNGAQTDYTGFACIVRFNSSGNIDARNGGAYAAASTIPFASGKAYHFRLAVNVPSHTYSIFVTPPGGSELTVGSNYAFRTEQNTVTSLNYWGDFVDNASGGAGNLSTCNFTDLSGATMTEQCSTLAESNTAGLTFSQVPGGPNGEIACKLYSTAVGQFLQFTVTGIVQGTTYDITIGYKSDPTRGQCQLSINGNTQSQLATLDEYEATSTWNRTADLGTFFAGSAGTTRTFTFTVSGKNSAATGYTMAPEWIALTPK